MLRRHADWPSRLQAYLDGCRDTRFTYGAHDCCLFTCDCVRAMTGHDMAAWFRGRYETRKGAMAAIRERTGGAGVAAIARYTAKELGMAEVEIRQARRGDMVLVGKGAKAILGVVSLSGMDVMCLGSKGIMRVGFEHATAAWRV